MAIDLWIVAGAFTSAFLPTILRQNADELEKGYYNYRFLWVVAFILNVIWLNIPGRYDSPVVDKNGKIQKFVPKKEFQTCFMPAGFTFAIWGLIYASETLVTLYIAFSSTSMGGRALSVVKNATLYWFAGNIYQVLWCVFFRKKYASNLWLSTSMLGAAGYSLVLAVMQLSEGFGHVDRDDGLALELICASLTIHAGWCIAATLVNVNIYLVKEGATASLQLAYALISAIIGAVIGVYLCYSTKSVTYGLTFAWAFYGLADKTLNDCDATAKIEKESLVTLGRFEQVACYACLATTLLVFQEI